LRAKELQFHCTEDLEILGNIDIEVEEQVDMLGLWNQHNIVISKFLMVNMLKVAVMDCHTLAQVNLDNSQGEELLGDIEGLENQDSRWEVLQDWELLSEDIGDLGYQENIWAVLLDIHRLEDVLLYVVGSR
jgi:hypothetical protein